ncbi:MAG: M14 family zinc carboxypeptidase, partial [Planctomycetota bacterium]
MKHQIKFKTCIAVLLLLSLVLAFVGTALAKSRARKPKAGNPAKHSFPALGISAQRKVQVSWNRFYDHAGLGAILARLHKAFPDLTRLYSIGKSTQGRDIWCLEVTARNIGEPSRKAGMYIDGNIHGNEVQGGEVVVYTAWYLCHQYGRLEKMTDLL